ncbi:MAG: hypothetical protein RSB20_03715, partial [Clostridia bacterium]
DEVKIRDFSEDDIEPDINVIKKDEEFAEVDIDDLFSVDKTNGDDLFKDDLFDGGDLDYDNDIFASFNDGSKGDKDDDSQPDVDLADGLLESSDDASDDDASNE